MREEADISRGGCHCGRIAFEAQGRPARVIECNCSICTKKGYLHWIVPRESFHLMTPADDLATYTFNTGVARHHFCPNCGVAPFYIPRSDPDKMDVNVRCLDAVDLTALEIDHFDGRNWEAAIVSYCAARGPLFAVASEFQTDPASGAINYGRSGLYSRRLRGVQNRVLRRSDAANLCACAAEVAAVGG
jgi:hypothetical protein